MVNVSIPNAESFHSEPRRASVRQAGFEPATSRIQTEYSGQTELLPDVPGYGTGTCRWANTPQLVPLPEEGAS